MPGWFIKNNFPPSQTVGLAAGQERTRETAPQPETVTLEFRFNEAPKVTKSMHRALADLSLDHLGVNFPGATPYPVHEKITMLPLTEISRLVGGME